MTRTARAAQTLAALILPMIAAGDYIEDMPETLDELARIHPDPAVARLASDLADDLADLTIVCLTRDQALALEAAGLVILDVMEDDIIGIDLVGYPGAARAVLS